MNLPPEILKKVKLLELAVRKKVNSHFAGEYRSTFRGQGMTFSDFREYVPGDDVRHIYWPLMARTNKLFIKKFDEERERTLMLVVDVSGSEDFGSREYFKGEVIVYLCALLSFAASKNKDPVGLLLYSDQVEHFVPPKKGRGHVLRILRDLFFHQPKSRGTRLSSAIEFLSQVLTRKSAIFIFSDFMDTSVSEGLRRIGRKHEVVAVKVNDPAENKIPDVGLVDLHDPETGEVMTVDTSSKGFQNRFKNFVKAQEKQTEDELKRSQVDVVQVGTDQDIAEPLIAYFARRRRR